jgi:hypothetical protein
MFVEAFVAKLPVEAFDEGIFDRLTGANEAQVDAAGVGPRIERTPAEFWAVVHHQDLRQADGLSEAIEDADDAQTWKRPVDFDRDAFAREVVDDVQRAEPTAVGQGVDHEVH